MKNKPYPALFRTSFLFKEIKTKPRETIPLRIQDYLKTANAFSTVNLYLPTQEILLR
jgi:hypothetical protein